MPLLSSMFFFTNKLIEVEVMSYWFYSPPFAVSFIIKLGLAVAFLNDITLVLFNFGG